MSEVSLYIIRRERRARSFETRHLLLVRTPRLLGFLLPQVEIARRLAHKPLAHEWVFIIRNTHPPRTTICP